MKNTYQEKTTIGEAIRHSTTERFEASIFWPGQHLVGVAANGYIFIFRREEYHAALSCEMDVEEDWLAELDHRCQDISATPEGLVAIKEIERETGETYTH